MDSFNALLSAGSFCGQYRTAVLAVLALTRPELLRAVRIPSCTGLGNALGCSAFFPFSFGVLGRGALGVSFNRATALTVYS